MFVFTQDTIAAFATAPSSGAVALLRVSGPGVKAALHKLTNKNNYEPRRAALAKIYDGGEILDSAIITFYAAPKSYTGEDIAEITLHASLYIKARVLQILADIGVRPAKPGEFSMRAFLAGKMDLAQAQGVADIIASKNKAAHKAAMNIIDGKLSAKFKNIRARLADLLAQIEVRIDDTDEELPPLDIKSASSELDEIINQTQTLAGTFAAGRLIKDGIKTAIVGLPNSGKSSLLNILLGYDRAIVSPEPGTTRDTIEADFEVNGQRVILTDTAGIREHSLDPAEKQGMQRTRAAARQADIIIFVKDNTAAYKTLLEEIKKEGKKIITVVNKADLLPQDFNGGGDILISCLTGAGIEELKNKIVETAGAAALGEDEIIITSAVHYEALSSAARELGLARENMDRLEISAEHLCRALNHLKELIGEVNAEDILDIIFSKFCVGK